MINYERIVFFVDNKARSKNDEKERKSFLEIETVSTNPTINPSIKSMDMNTRSYYSPLIGW